MFACRTALTSTCLFSLFVTTSFAAPAAQGGSCPVTSMVPTIYTGVIEAPGTTYPYTNTLNILQLSLPLTTVTTTGTWTYDGTTSTYTETKTLTALPSYHSGC
ncbi:hypothetical protein F5I97DRAFT_1831745 [Phlebopus sp. FC_14]|nr:hypothetical protein F5I97DRAFT_1831745 [Phlebopus sp. FC_14]